MNLYYGPKTDNVNIQFEDVMTPCHTDTPNWWRKLDFYRNKAKSVLDLWSKLSRDEKQEIVGFTTARACPAFRELFKNSFLVRFPTDLLLETTANAEYTWKSPTEGFIEVNWHETELVGSSISENYIVIKFLLPFLIAAKGTKALFLDPIYYKDQPFKVTPGVIEMKDNSVGIPLNIVVFFQKKDAVYHFKKDDPICLAYFTNRVSAKENRKLKIYDKKKFLLDYEDV